MLLSITDLVPAGGDVEATADTTEDAPVIIILIVCIVGIFLLALNIGLILFFVRRRKKRLESKWLITQCKCPAPNELLCEKTGLQDF